jgi:hypothetical protein
MLPLPNGGTGSSGTGSTTRRHRSEHILEYLEMVIRTSSNMHERFHHSTNMYIPFGSFMFAPVSIYIAGPGLLIASLTFLLSWQVNTLCSSSGGGGKNDEENADDINRHIAVSGGILAIACYLLFSNWSQCVVLLLLVVPVLGVIGTLRNNNKKIV